MLARGGAISGVALQTCLRAGATAATGCTCGPVGASERSASLAASPTACCAAAYTSACRCSVSASHAAGCSCFACAAPCRAGAAPAATPHALAASRAHTHAHALANVGPGRLPPSAPASAFFPFSLRALHTSAAATAAAAAPAPAARATAAADVDTDVDQRGRRSRRPQAADDSTPGGVRGRQSPDSSEDGDAEVQAVLSKLVGGLTRSGRKATARRIVEDALCAVRRHLKKGGVEDLK